MTSTFKIKDPDAPATDAQINAICTMTAKAGVEKPAFAEMTKGQASEIITALSVTLKDNKAPAEAKPSLMAMAHAMDNPAQPSLPVPVASFAFTRAQAKTVLSWVPVVQAECGLEPHEEDLADLLSAFVNAPQAIAGIEAAAQAAAAAKFGEPVATVGPAGSYAINTGEHVTFYKVENGQDKSAKGGKDWTGFVFLSQQHGDALSPIKDKAAKALVLDQIQAQGILASLKLYGTELGVCGVCHKTLTDPQSIAAGIGPVCKSHLGF